MQHKAEQVEVRQEGLEEVELVVEESILQHMPSAVGSASEAAGPGRGAHVGMGSTVGEAKAWNALTVAQSCDDENLLTCVVYRKSKSKSWTSTIERRWQNWLVYSRVPTMPT